MFTFLKRHPFPVQAYFDHSLMLTYAFPRTILQPLLPPGLALDAYEGFGFVAIALVQTSALRPAGLPRCFGRDFFLSGYRIFARYTRPNGQVLRGLKILRSDTDSRVMAWAGNRLTHYNYRKCTVQSSRAEDRLSLSIRTPGGEADLDLTAELGESPAAPPAGSIFKDWQGARHFVGPLPFTFDYELENHALVIIQGIRNNWHPKPVAVTVREAGFFSQPAFAGTPPRLCSAFFIENIPYRWQRGSIEKLPAESR